MSVEIQEKMENVELVNGENNEDADIVTPWDVNSQNETGIDYDKLISNYSVLLSKFCLQSMKSEKI